MDGRGRLIDVEGRSLLDGACLETRVLDQPLVAQLVLRAMRVASSIVFSHFVAAKVFCLLAERLIYLSCPVQISVASVVRESRFLLQGGLLLGDSDHALHHGKADLVLQLVAHLVLFTFQLLHLVLHEVDLGLVERNPVIDLAT